MWLRVPVVLVVAAKVIALVQELIEPVVSYAAARVTSCNLCRFLTGNLPVTYFPRSCLGWLQIDLHVPIGAVNFSRRLPIRHVGGC
jgi:hypothetical protein